MIARGWSGRGWLRTLAAGAAATVFLTAVTSCAEEGARAREGGSVTVDGVDYTAFLTRQLNPRVPPDKAFYDRPPPPPGKVHLGVFLKACNETARTQSTVAGFSIVDGAGNEYQPVQLDGDNPFAYHQETLVPEQCTPRRGSVAAMGSTGGALLLFELPLAALENRPLVLNVGTQRTPDTLKRIELDL